MTLVLGFIVLTFAGVGVGVGVGVALVGEGEAETYGERATHCQ